MWARRWTRTHAYVLRKCVPAKPRATFTFLSALAPGEAESTGSSVASAFSALVAPWQAREDQHIRLATGA